MYFESTMDELKCLGLCTPHVRLENCNVNRNDEPKWLWRRFVEYEIKCVVQKGCRSSTLRYEWRFDKPTVDLSEFDDKSRMIVRFFVLDTGSYELRVKVTEVSQGDTKQTIFATCTVTIREEDPVPIIDGGYKRNVPSRNDFIVRGETSINMNVPPWKEATLKFDWSCTILDQTVDFCLHKYQTNNLVVPAQDARPGAEYRFDLRVSANEGRTWFSTTQFVKVVEKAHRLSVRCISNCGLVVNAKKIVQLRAQCTDCDDFEKQILWVSTDESSEKINLDQDTVYGSHDFRLLILPNVLSEGKMYYFEARYQETSCTYGLKVSQSPSGGSCRVDPNTGTSLQTKFNIECDDIEHNDGLKFYLMSLDDFTTHATSNDGKFQLHLPYQPSPEYIVVAYDSSGLSSTYKLSITVKPHFSNIEQIVQAYEEGIETFDSVASLIRRQETEDALRYANILGIEAKSMPNYEHLEKLLISTYLQIVVDSQDIIFFLLTSLQRTIISDGVEVCKSVVELARKIGSKQYEFVASSAVKYAWTTRVQHVCKYLLVFVSKCLKSTEERPFILAPILPEVTVNFTAEPAVITENYPDYDDFDVEHNNNLSLYRQIVADIIYLNHMLGEAYLLTISPGEPVANFATPTFDIYTVRDNAQLLARNVMIGEGDGSVQFSSALETLGDVETYATVTIFAFPPFTWRNMSNRVTDIYVYLDKPGGSSIGSSSAAEVSFDIKDVRPVFQDGMISIADNLGEEDENYRIMVVRALIESGSAVKIYFESTSDELKVVVKHNQYPTIEDFDTSSFSITSTENSKTIKFPKEIRKFGNAWLYIGILPANSLVRQTRDDHDKSTIDFKLGLVAATCPSWDKNKDHWQGPTCRVGSFKPNKLRCNCRARGTYTYDVQAISHENVQFQRPQIESRASVDYTIFVYVLCTILGVYVLLIFCRNERKKIEQVYYLADNKIGNLYAYLAVVKTGNRADAGTTSNVGIKLFGTLHADDSHVLNYPDPEMVFLQRNSKDYFVISSEHYLGEVEKIYLWHDSVGTRPSWYCCWIEITDLQNGQKWHFEVQRWFSVLNNSTDNYETIDATQLQQQTKKDNFLQELVNYYKNNHFWNIFGTHSLINFAEYLTVFLAILLLIPTFIAIVYGLPTFTASDGFGLTHFYLPQKLIVIALVSSVISFSLEILWILMYKNVLIIWSISIFVVISCITVLVTFGTWYQHYTALAIVASTICAILIHIFVLEPIYLLYRFLKRPKSESDVSLLNSELLEQVESQRRVLYSTFGNNLLQPYLTEKRHPLTVEQQKTRAQIQLARIEFTELLHDLVAFLLYLLVLYFVVFASRDRLDVYGHQNIKNMLYGLYGREGLFEDVRSIEDLYNFLNETLIPIVHTNNWYGNYSVSDPGVLPDLCTKVLGVAAIRQLRARKTQCPVDNLPFNFTCIPEFSSDVIEKGRFKERWQIGSPSTPRLENAWIYHKRNSTSTFGYLEHYSGGGYSAPLGRTLRNSVANLKYLESSDWLDRQTRFVTVEFLAYNGNANLFHAVKLIVELSGTNFVVVSSSIYTARLLFINYEMEIMFLVTFLLFVITVIFLLYKNISNIYKNWREYLKNAWNLTDLLIIILSVLCIFIYYWRIRLVGSFLRKLERAKRNEIVPYHKLIYAEEVLTVVAALLICVSTMRLWKLLRFGNIFRVLEGTLARAWKPLSVIMLYHAIILILYSVVGYVTFGSNYGEFRGLVESLTSLLLIAFNLHKSFNYELVHEAHGGFGYFFYDTYILSSTVITVFYVAVLTINYSESCREVSNRKEYYSLGRYVRELYDYNGALLKRYLKRLRAGAVELPDPDVDVESKVRPKEDAYRYSRAVQVPKYRMELMEAIVRCWLERQENEDMDDERKLELMGEIARLVLLNNGMTAGENVEEVDEEEESEVGFVSRSNDLGVKIVPDAKILQMKCLLDAIINRNTIEDSEVVTFDGEEKTFLGVGREKTDLEEFVEKLDKIEETLVSLSTILDNIDIKIEKTVS